MQLSDFVFRLIIGGSTTCKPTDFKLFLNNDHNKKQLCQVLLDVSKNDTAVSRLEKCGTAIVVINEKAYQLQANCKVMCFDLSTITRLLLIGSVKY